MVDELGGIHILVNNAGITRDNLLFKMTEDDWDLVMGVHLKGAFLMTKAAQKHFVEQKYGKILNLSSVSALGNRGQANYSAAKMGIQGFTRTLGIELGPFGVNANAIAPGFIATEMTDATAAPAQDGASRSSAAQRRGATPYAGSASPRTSPPRRPSCAATRRPTSPARRCTSTAAPSSAERARGRRIGGRSLLIYPVARLPRSTQGAPPHFSPEPTRSTPRWIGAPVRHRRHLSVAALAAASPAPRRLQWRGRGARRVRPVGADGVGHERGAPSRPGR